MTDRCPSGKRTYERYVDALAHLKEVERRRGAAVPGSVYTCMSGGAFHVSHRRFTVSRLKGRGKSRRGVVLGG